jgi:hypothetical protein
MDDTLVSWFTKTRAKRREYEKDSKRACVVLSKGHEVVRPGYSRLTGAATKVTDRGKNLGDPSRVNQVSKTEQHYSSRVSRVSQDNSMDRQADRVSQNSRTNRRVDRVSQVNRVGRVGNTEQKIGDFSRVANTEIGVMENSANTESRVTKNLANTESQVMENSANTKSQVTKM